MKVIINLCLINLLLGYSIQCMAAPDCNNRTFYTDKDHPSASDDSSSPGTETQPFLTIQKLVDVLGDCVAATSGHITGIVKKTTVPYTEVTRKSGFDFGGITFLKGGVSDSQRIILKGEDDKRPVIDQQRLLANNGREVSGFYIGRDNFGSGDAASYITIQNFEIIHTNKPAIFADREGAEDNIGIVIENNYIHHLYGEDNIGGIRFDFCRDCIARNNIIHDLYNTRVEATSNLLNDRPFGLHAGIHGYQPEKCIIENNLIFNVAKGVFQKHPDNAGEDSYQVRYNIFYNNTEAAFTPQGNSLRPGLFNGSFHHNVVYDSGYAVKATPQSPTSTGQDFKIYNNTIVNSRGIAHIRATEQIEVFNNIRSVANDQYGSLIDFKTEHDSLQDYGVSYFNHNLYYQQANKWIINSNSGVTEEFSSVASWTQSNALNVVANPEQQSIFDQDPVFVDSSENNYALQNSSPAIQVGAGRGGSYPDYIGAIYSVSNTGQWQDDNNAPIGVLIGSFDIVAPISTLSYQAL